MILSNPSATRGYTSVLRATYGYKQSVLANVTIIRGFYVILTEIFRIMKHFSLSALIITITAGLTVCTGSCDSRRWRSTQGCVWSTTYHVTYRGKNDLSDSILATMSRVEKSLSPFDKGSVISLINRNESDRCDSLVAIVTAASRRVWSASGVNSTRR